MAKPTLEELKLERRKKTEEEERYNLAISMSICPDCGKKMSLKKGFFQDTLKCICGCKAKIHNSSSGDGAE